MFKKSRNLIRAAALVLLTFVVAVPMRAADEGKITLAVLALNDFHAGFVRNEAKDMPGAAAILQTLDSLKTVYPVNITLSCGDNFGGSYFYKATGGSLLPEFFHLAGIRYSALGNHEFDEGQDSLARKWRGQHDRPAGWDITYLSANVRGKDGKVPAFATPFATQKISLPGGKHLTLALVGMITSSTPQQASASKLKGLSFDGRYVAVLDSLARLPEYAAVAGADVRLLVTHIGTAMANGQPVWDDKDAATLSSLDVPDFHGILTAHTHQAVFGKINRRGYGVTQGESHGKYISVLKVDIDTAAMKVVGVRPELCRVNPRIALGKSALSLQAKVDSLLLHTKTRGGTSIGERLTTAKQMITHDRNNKMTQTRMGSLVCESYAETVRQAMGLTDKAVVVGVSHFGSIRGGFAKGAVSVLDVGESLPFSNAIRVYRVTGSELRALIDFGLTNSIYGRIQTSNLAIETAADGSVKRLTYVSPEGRRVKIKDKKRYILVADDYMTTGGDGYAPSFFPKASEIKPEGLPTTTDAFINYLKTKEEL